MSATCRSCEAPIEWAKTLKGKRIPLDLEPVQGGNLVLVDGVALPADHAPTGQPRRVSHFATCPNASHHRRRS